MHRYVWIRALDVTWKILQIGFSSKKGNNSIFYRVRPSSPPPATRWPFRTFDAVRYVPEEERLTYDIGGFPTNFRTLGTDSAQGVRSFRRNPFSDTFFASLTYVVVTSLDHRTRIRVAGSSTSGPSTEPTRPGHSDEFRKRVETVNRLFLGQLFCPLSSRRILPGSTPHKRRHAKIPRVLSTGRNAQSFVVYIISGVYTLRASSVRTNVGSSVAEFTTAAGAIIADDQTADRPRRTRIIEFNYTKAPIHGLQLNQSKRLGLPHDY